jgi:hypothetical protein
VPVAALLVVAVILIEGSDVGEPRDTVAVVLNWITWTAFLVELVTMLVVVPQRGRWLAGPPA